MIVAPEIERADDPSALRNPQLSDALQTRDMAAIAFALRHGPTVVPLESEGEVGGPEYDVPWIYRDSPDGDPVLLLFSDARFRPSTVPTMAGLAPPTWLHALLDARSAEITAVFIDFAGPYPLRASPADLIALLNP